MPFIIQDVMKPYNVLLAFVYIVCFETSFSKLDFVTIILVPPKGPNYTMRCFETSFKIRLCYHFLATPKGPNPTMYY